MDRRYAMVPGDGIGIDVTKEAVKVLDECRKKHEAALGNDKERSGWVALLRYHHGVALLESAKPTEAAKDAGK